MTMLPPGGHPKVGEIRSYLRDASVQADLHLRLASVQETVTTSIREAALVARMSEAQLRYTESRGLFSPRRASGDALLGNAGNNGQRRYSLPELRQLVVIGKLLEEYSPAEVQLFFQSYEGAIQEVIETQQTPLFERVFIAEQTVFQRFIVPRLLYIATCLLLENTFVGEAAIYIPVRDSEDALAALETTTINDSEKIEELGRSLIGWHSHGHPFSAFLNERPQLDTPASFRVQPLKTLLLGAQQMRGAAAPLGVHLAVEHMLEPALKLARTAIEDRLRRQSPQGPTPTRSGPLSAPTAVADPRAVAARLIWLTQQTPEDQSPEFLLRFQSPETAGAPDGQTPSPSPSPLLPPSPAQETAPYATQQYTEHYTRYALLQRREGELTYPALWRGISASSDSMVYSAPEFSDPVLGDSLLTYLAETVVQLGGHEGPDFRGNWRWQFACIMEPSDTQAPPHLRELVVRAQSSRSPHKPGVTRTSANPRFSLSTHAYQSGVAVYRARLCENDPVVAYGAIEHAHSAIALPIEGIDGAVIGALYVISETEDAFDQNDLLLLRVMSQFIGESLITARVRALSRENITAMITHPERVDRQHEFQSEYDFARDVEWQLRLIWEANARRAANLGAAPTRKRTGATAEATPDHEPSAAGAGAMLARQRLATAPAQTLSFLAVDFNDQGFTVSTYGEEISQLLLLAVGQRINDRLPLLFNQAEHFRLYRIFADRFYVVVRDVASEVVRANAYQLREALSGPYTIRRGLPIERVHARVVAITYDTSAFLTLGINQAPPTAALNVNPSGWPEVEDMRANITRTLDEALIVARHTNNDKTIITRESTQGRLVEWSPDTAAPIIDAEFVAKLAKAPEDSQAGLVYKLLTHLRSETD